jgi:hypothetical protein
MKAKKKPAVEAGLNPILSEESWRRQEAVWCVTAYWSNFCLEY